ncbi:MAG: alanine--tRNA ligase [Candidatus Aenigmarchaeota archaeon]|nr:alanine--tRNA ligase [Candidatus Aenigmarchaeota archaeon]
MLSKNVLIKEFQKNPSRYWKVKMFEDENFSRKRCAKCRKFFWSISKTTCGDTSCEDYGFIGQNATKKRFGYIEMWKEFEKFFSRNSHYSMPRYPVVSRWRPDLFFTIASIQDFQRLDSAGLTFEYPTDRLVVPQVCLRFPDIPNVGVTGKHHTSFIMAGQHAFGYPKTGYWKDRCIELNFEFLTDVMGIDKSELTYVEDLWAMPDMSAFGPCVETFSRGLELVNSVFMQFTTKNNKSAELPMKVVDVGWGLERLTWFSQGTPTSYDATFGKVTDHLKGLIDYDETLFLKYASHAGSLNIDEIKDLRTARGIIAKKIGVTESLLQKKVSPLQAIYSIADHTKTLLYAIADGGLPSNVGGGYNLRVILRRALGFIDEMDLKIDLPEICAMHAEFLHPLDTKLMESLVDVEKIISFEADRFVSSRAKASKIVEVIVNQKVDIDEEKMIKLYESNGVTPEMIKNVAAQHNVEIKIPENFYESVSKKHMGHKDEEKRFQQDLTRFKPTKPLYYDGAKNFRARILKVFDGKHIILDRTGFYPTSGGQIHDIGTLNGFDVVKVEKYNNVIVHTINGKYKGQKAAKGVVDWDRREQLMKNHTATHIMNAAARIVLGNHVNQAGAEKVVDKARLDITHYKSLSDEEINKIEDVANRIVASKIQLNKTIMSRTEAERAYGSMIYQGGAVPSVNIRVVEIPGYDVEACGGTHCDSTADIKAIKIIKTERIQDGLVRLEFAAGSKAWDDLKKKEGLLKKASEVFNVADEHLPATAQRFFEEWKEKDKIIEKLKVEVAFLKAENLRGKIRDNKLFHILPYNREQLIEVADAMATDHPKLLVVLAGVNGDIVGKRGVQNEEDVGNIVSDICNKCGGSGGGSTSFAQGRGELAKIRSLFAEMGF